MPVGTLSAIKLKRTDTTLGLSLVGEEIAGGDRMGGEERSGFIWVRRSARIMVTLGSWEINLNQYPNDPMAGRTRDSRGYVPFAVHRLFKLH